MLSALESELEEAGDLLDLPHERGKRDHRARADGATRRPVIRFVNLVLYQAVQDRASDIHFEPFENEFKIRYRVDGALYEMAPPPKHLALPVTSRIKVISGLNIAERRLPQDGRIQLTIAGRTVDFRVSTLPTQFGESVVLRVLDRSVVSAGPRKPRHARTTSTRRSPTTSPSPTASSSSPGPPGRARRPRCTPRCAASTRSRASCSPPRTRSSTTSKASCRSRSTRPSASPSPACCAPSSARTRTSSWSVKSATWRPPRSPSRPRSPATWCSARCTPTTRRARSPA